MGKAPVRVYVRMRPTAGASERVEVLPDRKSIAVHFGKDAAAGTVNNQVDQLRFSADGVLVSASQEDVYSTCCSGVVDDVMAGYHGTVFAYGQTGAGKTYSMSGDPQAYRQRGMIPRALHTIFSVADRRTDREYAIRVSYLEIYNEVLYDLLSDSPATADKLTIVDGPTGGVEVRGMAQHVVGSEEEALSLFFRGEASRATASHTLNSASSRSHAIFTVHVEARVGSGTDERATTSKLNLVDLGGSERTKKTGVTGQSLREAMYINTSLTFLEQTVNALAKRGREHVPFRQSKLTAVLRDGLGGSSKTVMLTNVWPEDSNLEETVSTLRFAQRVRMLVTDAVINESTDPALLCRRYERRIAELKQELAMRDTFAGRGKVSYDDFDEAQRGELRATVERFLRSEANVYTVPVDSLKMVREAFMAMRAAYADLDKRMADALASAATASAAAAAGGTGAASGAAPAGGDPGGAGGGAGGGDGGDGTDADGAPALVGDLDATSGGFDAGEAPSGARPPRLDAPTSTGGDAGEDVEGPADATEGAVGEGGAGSEGGAGRAADKAAAFEAYKAGAGAALAVAAREARGAAVRARKDLAAAGARVNAAKRAIDAAKNSAEMKQGGADDRGEDDVLDEEEFLLLVALRNAKAEYRAAFDDVREARERAGPASAAERRTKRALLDAFAEWHSAGGYESALAEDRNAVDAVADGDAGAPLDAAEEFDAVFMARVLHEDPESSAFHAARKNVRKAKATAAGRVPAAAYKGAKGSALINRKHEMLAARMG